MRRTILRGVIVALVVGTILNLVNQFDTVAAGLPVVWWKAALCYLVPFCVSVVSVLLADRGRSRIS